MIRLMTVIEASSVTGPAKNLLEFGRVSREPEDGGEGVEATLVTFHRTDEYDAPTDAIETDFTLACRERGIPYVVIPERKRFDRRAVEMLRQVAHSCAPDIVESMAVKSHCLMRMSGLWRSHPWVAWHHAYSTTDFKQRCYNHVDRWSLRAADHVVTVNQQFVRDLERIGVSPGRLQMVANDVRMGWNDGVKPEAIAEVKARLGILEGEKVVLSVARLSQEKGHVYLLRALKELRSKFPDMPLRLVMVGQGPEQEAIEHEAQKLGITDCIIFAGQVRDVGPFFALADVLALPSLVEGVPNALLEAIAAGVPVVSTPVGGIGDLLVHEQDALLVAPRDVAGLTIALARVLTDMPLVRSLVTNAFKVAERQSPEVRLQTLLELYRSLARSKTSPASS